MWQLLVEKEYIGGTCLNYGCIPSKFYLSVAKECEEVRHDANLGLLHGEVKPQLKSVVEKQHEVVEQLRNGMISELNQKKVEVIFGEAVLYSRQSWRSLESFNDCFSMSVSM